MAALAGCQTVSERDTYPEATQAEPRTKEFPWMSVSRWYEMHSEDVAIAATEEVELLFIGDSITESWDWGDGRDEVYRRYFADYQAANFAIGGDMTQNLLWRLQHNLKGQLNPEVVVLMIGVNNFLHEQHSPEAVAAGIDAVLEQTRQNYAQAKILLIGILPFHQNADNPSRRTVTRANELIAGFADNERVFFTNVNDEFLNDQGEIPQPLMDDFIHPSAAGLEIIARRIAPIVKPWLLDATD